VLSEGQQDISSYFAGAWRSGPPPPFVFLPWEGAPRLEGSIGSLGCELHAIHEGGDHWIVLGRVVALYRSDGALRPLMFFRGAYATLGEERALLTIGW
jgi:3-hydroxy-9,10-secoandrosta-1,3,5(10)-triene-9,17-dione monooxygenase reductase component